jgi:Na+/H+ antiporter NhaC
MPLRAQRFLTILPASLLTATAFAHLLEMPMKMKASAAQWLGFPHTLHAWFAIVGAPLELLTILCAGLPAYRMRHARGFKLTLAAAAILAVAFLAIWVGLIHPVNSRTAS